MNPSRLAPWLLIAALITTPTALAQAPVPGAPAATPPASAALATPVRPPSPVSGMRNKISAGDLLSAESILEVHRARNGEDGPALVGLSWLARGALLLGEPVKAQRYATEVREKSAQRIAAGADITKDHDLEYALGSAIEVEAQLIERKQGARKATAFVRAELTRQQKPASLRTRLHKRLAMLSLEGSPAPEIVAEDFVGDPPPTLASLRGKPVLLFLWSESCSDCKAQAAALAAVTARHAATGLQLIALTQYYEDDAAARITEKARVDSVWKDVYQGVGNAKVVLSNESMMRYGGSSTPTLVFIDRAGAVRRYTPTRLTEAELDRAVTALLR